MNVFKKVKFLWWHVTLLKISLISFGILVGVSFQNFFISYVPLLWILMAIPGVYVGYVWLKQK